MIQETGFGFVYEGENNLLLLKMNKYECQLVNNKQLKTKQQLKNTQTKPYSHITSSSWKEINTNTPLLSYCLNVIDVQ